MLCDLAPPPLSEFDRSVYRLVVPRDHCLVRLLKNLPWHDFEELLAPYYSEHLGRPPILPVLMLKLTYLGHHYNLSDREVIARSGTDMAFRYFLQIPLVWKLPDSSSMCLFRARLGVEGFQRVFDQVVHFARELGVVKDRLRIKDATHVLADIARPTALALVAQTRDKLLALAEPFAPLLVEGERIKLATLRDTTQKLPVAERLVTRVAQLRDILAWVDDLTKPDDAETNSAWKKLSTQRDLAHHILADQEDPDRGDRTISTTDPDARRGKHGDWFDGYLDDILLDPDSQIITAISVLPAGGDEAADAVKLISQEEATHGNDVQALSIDGVGFKGPVLRELEDPQGLCVEVYVPPPKEAESSFFRTQEFVEDPAAQTVTCPAGKKSTYHYYDAQNRAKKYRFPRTVCSTCPLLARCMEKVPARHGRTVNKSDYQAEHERVRQRAHTEQYRAIRREHPMVERKLCEMMNRHGGRRARYRGKWKVLLQQLMIGVVVNAKRLMWLLRAPACAQ